MGVLDMLGGPSRRSGGMSPVMVGLMGLLAYRTIKGKGRLADMLGTGSDATGAGGPLAGGTLGGGLKIYSIDFGRAVRGRRPRAGSRRGRINRLLLVSSKPRWEKSAFNG